MVKSEAQILSHGEVVDHIAEALGGLEGDTMVELYQQYFPDRKITYLGDSVYRVETTETIKDRKQNRD
jgi:hypothetical protein